MFYDDNEEDYVAVKDSFYDVYHEHISNMDEDEIEQETDSIF